MAGRSGIHLQRRTGEIASGRTGIQVNRIVIYLVQTCAEQLNTGQPAACAVHGRGLDISNIVVDDKRLECIAAAQTFHRGG